jgi:hypothetical protein
MFKKREKALVLNGELSGMRIIAHVQRIRLPPPLVDEASCTATAKGALPLSPPLSVSVSLYSCESMNEWTVRVS